MDSEGEVGEGESGVDRLGDDGGGAFGRVIEDGGEPGEGAGGAGKGEEGDEDGGMHDVHAEIFLFGGEAEDQEDQTKAGGNEGGVVGGAGEDETGEAEEDVGKGETGG